MSLILGIETSCDECSASVVLHEQGRFRPLSMSTYSQIKLHQPYGGVVPEVASRNHLEQIQPILTESLRQAGVSVDECDAIAVTNRPGLIGALLVGVTAAKALGYLKQKPLVPVHHLEGHLMSAFLSTADRPAQEIQFPAVFLVVSGGHTHLHYFERPPAEWAPTELKTSLIGRSIDDAAGEAFDKTAKLLGFPYPGGRWIDETAKQKGAREAFDFPRALKDKKSFDFSFSGLKTSFATALKKETLKQNASDQTEISATTRADLCASVQEAIVAPLVEKTLRLAKDKRARSVVIVGGVAANSRIRERFNAESPVPVIFPDLEFCTDNAAMIAAAGVVRFEQGLALQSADYLQLNAFSSADS